MLKRCAIIGIAIISLALVSCESNAPKAKSNEQDQTTINCTIRYYINDSLLQYVNITLVDSLHLEEGALPYSTAPIDTLMSDFWQSTLRALYQFDKELYVKIPVASIRVLTFERALNTGSYRYCLQLARNTKEIPSTILPVLIAREATTTIKKWTYQPYFDANKQLFVSDLPVYLSGIQLSSQTTIFY